jgi:hypothetical protein
VPLSLYAAMFGAGLGGAALGAAYAAVVLGQSALWIVVLTMVLAEAWAGARLGARRQAKPLTTDQRGRVAIVYTSAVTLPVVALTLALSVSKLPFAWADRIEHLSSGGVALALLASLVTLAAVALLRFLLLSLFAPRPPAATRGIAREPS